MNVTRLVDWYYRSRRKEIAHFSDRAEEIQTKVLRRLLDDARHTEWGLAHSFKSVVDYETFSKTSSLNSYEDMEGDIDRMRRGGRNILYKGCVRWYAKSSGTTSSKSKFIPVSRKFLYDTHLRGGQDTVALYLANNPNSRMFPGKAFILGGSHAPNYNLAHSLVGDLSAIMIENAYPFVQQHRFPNKQIALLPDFEEKRERIARTAIKANVTNISGVPSWMLSVITRILEVSGKTNLEEVWPNIEVFFHGGVSFGPYRNRFECLISKPGMHYMETYNASEGFFGIQSDLEDPSLLLMIDYGIFYEFVPLDQIDKPTPSAVPLWGVELGKNYAIIISTSAGLWRYMLGDTVRFTQRNPYKFIITGRTKSFINAFGEELIVDNAERAISLTCKATGAQVREYTAAPIYMDVHGKCRHQWLVEFSKMPESIENFAVILDKQLQSINSDYEAKRSKNITLQQLELIPARKNLFDDWLKQKGKLGGQHKVPRLNNSRTIIDQLLSLNRRNTSSSL